MNLGKSVCLLQFCFGWRGEVEFHAQSNRLVGLSPVAKACVAQIRSKKPRV